MREALERAGWVGGGPSAASLSFLSACYEIGRQSLVESDGSLADSSRRFSRKVADTDFLSRQVQPFLVAVREETGSAGLLKGAGDGQALRAPATSAAPMGGASSRGEDRRPTRAYEKIAEGLNEALQISRGEAMAVVPAPQGSTWPEGGGR